VWSDDQQLIISQNKSKRLTLNLVSKKSSLSNISIAWIEHLLQTPIPNHRKYCIWRILAPYLVNIRGLSEEEALAKIVTWLDKCNKLKRLSFYARPRVRAHIQRVQRIGYYPISWGYLQKENTELYNLLLVSRYAAGGTLRGAYKGSNKSETAVIIGDRGQE